MGVLKVIVWYVTCCSIYDKKHMYRRQRHRVSPFPPLPRGWEVFFFFGHIADISDLEFDPYTVFGDSHDDSEVPVLMYEDS